MIAIADTSFIVAIENKLDQHHQRCRRVFEQEKLIYLPQSVLNEVCYLLTKAGGNQAAASFLHRLPKINMLLTSLQAGDLARTADILVKYADSRVDFVDASIVAIAERLNVTRILTLDQRDFNILRPTHVDRFELLPGG